MLTRISWSGVPSAQALRRWRNASPLISKLRQQIAGSLWDNDIAMVEKARKQVQAGEERGRCRMMSTSCETSYQPQERIKCELPSRKKVVAMSSMPS